MDWFGISYFNQDQKYMNPMVKLAREHKKPVMIAEATPRGMSTIEGSSVWDNWFVPLFAFVDANNIKAICYINWDWETISMFAGQGWGDARVQDNSDIKANWLNELNKDRYLQSSKTLFSFLGYRNN